MKNNATFAPSNQMANEMANLKLNLLRVLQVRGISQERLSEMTGITQANISNIVTGKASPRNATLMKIADAIGCEIHEMYDAPDTQTIYCPHCGGRIDIVKHTENEK